MNPLMVLCGRSAKKIQSHQDKRWVDSRKSGIVAADVRRPTLKKTNGTEPPYVGCYGFLNRSCYTHPGAAGTDRSADFSPLPAGAESIPRSGKPARGAVIFTVSSVVHE